MTCRSIDKGRFECVTMTHLTEKEEKFLDRNGGITLERDGFKFFVTSKNILAYGEIDFSNGSEDMEYLSTLTFLDHYIERGVCVPARYNYEKHCCYSKCRKPEYYDTTKPEVLLQYVHGVLGKPKSCLIFRTRDEC